jgi:hypothetical protein
MDFVVPSGRSRVDLPHFCKMSCCLAFHFRNYRPSFRRLSSLTLYSIPHSGYIPPEAMVTCISALVSLEDLILGFRSPHFLPESPTGKADVRVRRHALSNPLSLHFPSEGSANT